jgi:hypothetical protein
MMTIQVGATMQCDCHKNRALQAYGAPWHTHECLLDMRAEFIHRAEQSRKEGHMSNYYVYLRQAGQYEKLASVAKGE